MSTSKEYIEFVLEQLDEISDVTYKKMFGEYMVYVSGKPILLVCDNCVMVKKAAELSETLPKAALMTAQRYIIYSTLKIAS